MLDWNDRSSWVLLDRSSWVSLDRSSWVWVLPNRSWGDLESNRCLWIRARENSVRSDLVGSDQCLWIRAREIGVCGSVLDQVLPDRSYGSVFVTKMVWIRLKGRADMCLGIEMGIERERESNKSEKMGRKRESACAYV